MWMLILLDQRGPGDLFFILRARGYRGMASEESACVVNGSESGGSGRALKKD